MSFEEKEEQDLKKKNKETGVKVISESYLVKKPAWGFRKCCSLVTIMVRHCLVGVYGDF